MKSLGLSTLLQSGVQHLENAFRICICDDEPLHRRKLKRVLINYAIQADRELMIDEYDTSQQLYGAAKQYDVIFLDIEFPGDELGIQVAKNLRKADVQSIIIFLTSYPQYSLEGYEAEAFRYLIKPITVETVAKVMDAVFAKLEQKPTLVTIKVPGGNALLDGARISMIETVGRKQNIHYDNEIIATWEPLKEIYSKLPDWAFAYAHQGCIVNLEQVHQLYGNEVFLVDGTKVTLSRRQKKAFVFNLGKMLEHTK